MPFDDRPYDPCRDAISRARALVADPATWTTCAEARDASGMELDDALDPRAVRFCAYGALKRSAFVIMESVLDAQAIVDEIEHVRDLTEMIRVNDHEGREAALLLLDRWLA